MPIIAALLVALAVEKYQNRQAAKHALTESHDQETGVEIGNTSPELERSREEEAFHELQNYANFQRALSSKVQDDLSRDDSNDTLRSPDFKASSNRSNGDRWCDPLSEARYTTQGPLPCPIIISQRADGSDGPGWVRSYSTALMNCGIPQQPFLRFLDSFNESFQFIPRVEAVNIAALESGIGWRDGTTNLASVIPSAVQLAKSAQRNRRFQTFLDDANLSFLSPRGLAAMIITSAPEDVSSILTVNVFDAANFRTPATQDLTFSELDQENPLWSGTHPQARHPKKLQKMSNFISDYGSRRPATSTSNNLPLFSLISNISNSRESKKDSHRRRNRRFQRVRPSSGSSGTSPIEGAFGVTKVGKNAGPTQGIMDRMTREDLDDGSSERVVGDTEIQPGAIYLVIVNDPSEDIKITDQGEMYNETEFNIDESLHNEKENEGSWYEADEHQRGLLGRENVESDFDESMVGVEDLPPRYSIIHPQHRAKVQAWREAHPDANAPVT